VFQRISDGIIKASKTFGSHLRSLFSQNQTPEEFQDALETLLITSDVGIHTTQKIMNDLKKNTFMEFSPLKDHLESLLMHQLKDFEKPWPKNDASVIKVWLMVGVNGVGKTTTLGKLAFLLNQENFRTHLIGADTFRAGALEQLEILAQRCEVPVFLGQYGKDPASVVFQGLQEASAQKSTIVLIDTAGRLHNNGPLMDSLRKMYRVLEKHKTIADRRIELQVILVLDGTTGQNALVQTRLFQETIPLDSIIMTKLDGTAKGGILFNILETFKIPVLALGHGEKPKDLSPFQSHLFVRDFLKTPENPL
jgi:fused signal recognition particle receptor